MYPTYPIGKHPSNITHECSKKKNCTITLSEDDISNIKHGWSNSTVAEIQSNCEGWSGKKKTQQKLPWSFMIPFEDKCQVNITLENMCGEQVTISLTIGELHAVTLYHCIQSILECFILQMKIPMNTKALVVTNSLYQ